MEKEQKKRERETKTYPGYPASASDDARKTEARERGGKEGEKRASVFIYIYR